MKLILFSYMLIYILEINNSITYVLSLENDDITYINNSIIELHRRIKKAITTNKNIQLKYWDAAKRGDLSNSINQNSICRIHSMHIDFSKIGMNWIVSPSSINIKYCYGICVMASYEKTSLMYGTIVANHITDRDIPECCYPRLRSDIAIQYRVGRNIKTSTIKNFMPQECACG